MNIRGTTLLYLVGSAFLKSQAVFFLLGTRPTDPNFVRGIVAINVLLLTFAALLHGFQRYGLKRILTFFAITAVVSWSFETSSIANGFPFGHYVYSDHLGAKLGAVPWLILPSYFSMGYFSWTMAHVLVQHFQRAISGLAIFTVPLIGSCLMVMWDLSIDPVASSLSQNWIWRDGGAYFGVPYSNFLGWFLTVYVIFQVFALYLSRAKTEILEQPDSRFLWNFAAALYFSKALTIVLQPLTMTQHLEIHQSMSLVALFTMGFASVLTFVNIAAKFRVSAARVIHNSTGIVPSGIPQNGFALASTERRT